MGILRKGTVSAYHPNLYGNCALPQNFHTTKFGEIRVFFYSDCQLGSKNGILGVKLEYKYTSGYEAGFEVWFILYTANKTSWYWNRVLLLTLMCQSVLTNTIN